MGAIELPHPRYVHVRTRFTCAALPALPVCRPSCVCCRRARLRCRRGNPRRGSGCTSLPVTAFSVRVCWRCRRSHSRRGRPAATAAGLVRRLHRTPPDSLGGRPPPLILPPSVQLPPSRPQLLPRPFFRLVPRFPPALHRRASSVSIARAAAASRLSPSVPPLRRAACALSNRRARPIARCDRLRTSAWVPPRKVIISSSRNGAPRAPLHRTTAHVRSAHTVTLARLVRPQLSGDAGGDALW